MKTHIRRISAKEVKKLAEIARQTFFDTFTGTCTDADMRSFLDEHYNEQVLGKELEDPDSIYYFAEVNSVPVAYLYFKEDYSNFPADKTCKALEIKRIYVLKEYHGMGIAQELMNETLSYAAEHKYEMIWLGVWEHNIRAQKFYFKCGFIDSGLSHDFPIGKTPQTDIWLWKYL